MSAQPWGEPDADPLGDIRQIERDDWARTARPFTYGDCGMSEVPQDWEHGPMALPVELGEDMPGEGCER